jgi:hypothetical protein
MVIDNDDKLSRVMFIDFKEIVARVAEAVVELLKGYVQAKVYDVWHPPEGGYVRQHEIGKGGFYESWVYDDIETIGGKSLRSAEFSTKIFSDPMEMEFDPMNFVHGSPIGGGFGNIDRRDEMDAAIAESFHRDPRHDIHTEDGSGPWEKPRDYWSPFIDVMDLGTFEEIFEEECKKFGITLI